MTIRGGQHGAANIKQVPNSAKLSARLRVSLGLIIGLLLLGFWLRWHVRLNVSAFCTLHCEKGLNAAAYNRNKTIPAERRSGGEHVFFIDRSGASDARNAVKQAPVRCGLVGALSANVNGLGKLHYRHLERSAMRYVGERVAIVQRLLLF